MIFFLKQKKKKKKALRLMNLSYQVITVELLQLDEKLFFGLATAPKGQPQPGIPHAAHKTTTTPANIVVTTKLNCGFPAEEPK